MKAFYNLILQNTAVVSFFHQTSICNYVTYATYATLCNFLFRILHTDGFNKAEIQIKKGVIYQNIVKYMILMLEKMNTLNISIDNPELEVKTSKLKRRMFRFLLCQCF